MLKLPLLSALMALITAVTGTSQSQEWHKTPYRLSSPGTFVRYEANVTSDRFGRIYTFWSQDSARPCCVNGEHSLLRFARLDGSIWSEPVDLQRVVNGRVELVSVDIDSSDTLHAVWVQRAGPPALFYSSVGVENALAVENWQTPRRLEIVQPGTAGLRMRVDGAGTIHLLFARSQGIFYTRSVDGGLTWTTPVQLDIEKPQSFVPGVFHLEVDEFQRLHVLWHQYGDNFVGRLLQYVRSTDGGQTWSSAFVIDQFDPATDSALTQSVGPAYGFSVVADTVHVLWIGGPPGGPTGVGREERISRDGGLTWEPINSSILGGLWGSQGGDGLSSDAAGRVHWVGLARNWISQSQLWEGLWAADWSNGVWSITKPVVTALSPGIDSPRLASTAGGRLLTAFRNAPTPTVLYATHTTGPYFYFPHYADGDGWSMQIVINNLSANRTFGSLTFFDSGGRPQELPLDTGNTSRIELDLQPYSTLVLQTLGSSSPLKTGFIGVELSEPKISGVAIFQNANGTEASVLPERVGRRYALLVERSASLQTGIAFVRHTPAQAITLKLYDLQGNLVESKDFTGGVQNARFLEELFPESVQVGFRGTLVLESEALFSAMGLRFGAGVLSTLPVTDLDAIAGNGVYFFPHYADGSDLSMLFAVNNLSNIPASGRLNVYSPAGGPQSLPFENGLLNEISLSLAPNATTLLQTRGASNPLKTGFVRVQLDQQAISGLAIFRYPDGREASVLPAYPGKKFAVFVERSAKLNTGFAISRSGTQPVMLRLYDHRGISLGSRQLPFDQDYQRARFLTEVFDGLPEQFRGLLVMESLENFTTVGLRFGGNVLSTIPVSRID